MCIVSAKVSFCLFLCFFVLFLAILYVFRCFCSFLCVLVHFDAHDRVYGNMCTYVGICAVICVYLNLCASIVRFFALMCVHVCCESKGAFLIIFVCFCLCLCNFMRF